jgi:hypothetical protein
MVIITFTTLLLDYGPSVAGEWRIEHSDEYIQKANYNAYCKEINLWARTRKKDLIHSFPHTLRVPYITVNITFTILLLGEPGQLSQYTKSLQTGRSGDPIPVVERFSTPVQTSSKAHPASYTMGTESFLGGKVAGASLKKEYSNTSNPP